MNEGEKALYCIANCSSLSELSGKVVMKDVEIKLLNERIAELEAMLGNGKIKSNNKRITADKELEIVKQYYDGKSISLIGRELDVSRNTVYKTLRRNEIYY